MIKSISVFCGSNTGKNPLFMSVAADLGKEMALQKINLVYGGAKIGIMGSVAQAALEHGAEVLGVIPEMLKKKEVVHDGLTQLITTKTMAERKELLINKADGFIHLPGGIGTLDELAEVMSLVQLSIINKPIALLNVNGYFDSLIAFFERAVNDGLMHSTILSQLIIETNPKTCLERIQSHQPSTIGKWIDIKE